MSSAKHIVVLTVFSLPFFHAPARAPVSNGSALGWLLGFPLPAHGYLSFSPQPMAIWVSAPSFSYLGFRPRLAAIRVQRWAYVYLGFGSWLLIISELSYRKS